MFVAPSATHSVKNSTFSVYDRQFHSQREDPGLKISGYSSQYFPVRPLIRVGESDGAWLVAHKAEERRRYNELLRQRHAARRPAQSSGHGGGASGVGASEQDEEPTCLDGFYLLRIVRVDDPSFVCHVDLSGRNLSEVKEEDLQLFDSVTSLKAGENLLRLEPLNGFPNLRELEIPFNGLRNLKLAADSFPNLEFLDVSYNELTKEDLFNIGLLKRLRRLHAGGNGLSELPEDLALPEIDIDGEANQRFQNLECLMLDDNRLSDPKTFASLACLRKLRVLNLEKNEFAGIPFLKVSEDGDGLSVTLSSSSAAVASAREPEKSARGSSRRSTARSSRRRRAEAVAMADGAIGDSNLVVVASQKPLERERSRERSSERQADAASPAAQDSQTALAAAAVVVPSGDAENGQSGQVKSTEDSQEDMPPKTKDDRQATEERRPKVEGTESQEERKPKPEDTSTLEEPKPKPDDTQAKEEPKTEPEDIQAQEEPEPKSDDTQAKDKPESKPNDTQAREEPKPEDTQAQEDPEPKPEDNQAQEEAKPKPEDTQIQEEPESKPKEAQDQEEPKPKSEDTQAQEETKSKPEDTQAQEEPEPKPEDTQSQEEPKPKSEDTQAKEEAKSKPEVTQAQEEPEPKPDNDATIAQEDQKPEDSKLKSLYATADARPAAADDGVRKPSVSTTDINRNIEQLNLQMMRLNRPASAPLVELAPFDMREIERAIGRRFVDRRQAPGPAPFPALRSLNLGANRVAREESLVACGIWPALTELLIHDNPLCRTRSGELPLLHRLLTQRLGVRIARQKPRQGPKPRIEVESKPSRRVTTRVPPVPKVDVDRLLMGIRAPPALGPAEPQEAVKGPTDDGHAGEEDAASDWGDDDNNAGGAGAGVFLTSVADQSAEAASAGAAAAAAAAKGATGGADEDDEDDDVDLLLLSDAFGDADADADAALPQDVLGSVKALQYLLDHPITLDHGRPPLAEAGAAYREHRATQPAAAPAPRPTRAELARGAIETSRRANPRMELPLAGLLQHQQPHQHQQQHQQQHQLPPLRVNASQRRRLEQPQQQQQPQGAPVRQVEARRLLGGVQRRYQAVRDRSLQDAKAQAREKIAAMVDDIRASVHQSLRERQTAEDAA